MPSLPRSLPNKGKTPAGFGGARAKLGDIRLIVVTAEPGDAVKQICGTPAERLEAQIATFEEFFEHDSLRRNGRRAPFHKNLRYIVELCWPGKSLDQVLRLTWFTNTVLCPAPKSGGVIKEEIERTCGQTYLNRQLELLPAAYVLVLGSKARRRMTELKLRIDGFAQHPSARRRKEAGKSWMKAARQFREWQRSQELA